VPHFLTSALVWSQWSASQPCWFTSEKAAFTKIYMHSECIWHLIAFNMNYIVKDTLGIPLSTILSSDDVLYIIYPYMKSCLALYNLKLTILWLRKDTLLNNASKFYSVPDWSYKYPLYLILFHDSTLMWSFSTETDMILLYFNTYYKI
jgi:hypothetical protein